MLPNKIYWDSAFDHLFDGKANADMKCDIYEKEGVCHIEAAIPGFHKDEIAIECNNGHIVITASKSSEIEENKKYIKQERFYGKVQRQFYIGDMNSDDIQAKFENGILKISIPKQETNANKKIIEIK